MNTWITHTKTLFSPIYIYSTNNICILKTQVHNLWGLDSGQLIHRWLAFSGIPQEHASLHQEVKLLIHSELLTKQIENL